jgi:hypothetical protein
VKTTVYKKILLRTDCYCLTSIALLEMAVKPIKASDTASAILFSVRQSLKVVTLWTAELSELTRTDPQRDGFKAVYKVGSLVYSLLLAIAQER